jgi:Meiotically up-regulated gene 113
MNKDHIISAIKRTAQQNGGVPLGIDRFREETGIEKKDWIGIYWAKWSEAQIEAGLIPNKFSTPAFEEEWMIEKVIALIRELGHFPSKYEFQLKRREDNGFPTDATLRNRFGKKSEMAGKVIAYCDTKLGLSDIKEICSLVIIADDNHQDLNNVNSEVSSIKLGFVYLLRHDKVYKIGKSVDVTRRYKEIKLQMPYQMDEIHVIETDDPSGIEAYWHNRFRDKRLEGEWFKLSAEDVKIFKKRKFM